MIRKALLLCVVGAFGFRAAYGLDLDSVCLDDSAIAPYYMALLDTLKSYDTTGTLDSAQVRATCDSVIVYTTKTFLGRPVQVTLATVTKANSCSLKVAFLPAIGLSDTMVNACALGVAPHRFSQRAAVSQQPLSLQELGNGALQIRCESAAGLRNARLSISMVNGREVRSFGNAFASDRSIVWNGLDQRGRTVGRGLFVCTLRGSGGIVASVTFTR
jgi:hypothetical protein